MGEEREAVLVEKGVVDVEPAIDEHAVPQPAAGIDAQRPHAAAGAVVDLVVLDAADLGRVDEVRMRCGVRRAGEFSCVPWCAVE